MFGNAIANMMIKPGKSPVFSSPAAVGLKFEDVSFQTSDGVTLSGWLVEGGSDKVVIQSHFGVQCSRSGYTPKEKGFMKLWDRDIEFLNQAKYLVDAGYSVLMYDMRNHGNSGTGKIPFVTWGSEEGKDVVAAVNFISNHERYKNSSIGLLSICMGSSASTFAYGKEHLADYHNVKAMISVQPLTYTKFVRAMGMPEFLINAGDKAVVKKTGLDLNDTFMPFAKDIKVPTRVIQNKNDPWTDHDMVNDFFNNLTVEKDLLWIELEDKRAAAYDWIGNNPEPVLQWFKQYLD